LTNVNPDHTFPAHSRLQLIDYRGASGVRRLNEPSEASLFGYFLLFAPIKMISLVPVSRVPDPYKEKTGTDGNEKINPSQP
jgi:hypothetical protein